MNALQRWQTAHDSIESDRLVFVPREGRWDTFGEDANLVSAYLGVSLSHHFSLAGSFLWVSLDEETMARAEQVFGHRVIRLP